MAMMWAQLWAGLTPALRRALHADGADVPWVVATITDGSMDDEVSYIRELFPEASYEEVLAYWDEFNDLVKVAQTYKRRRLAATTSLSQIMATAMGVPILRRWRELTQQHH